MTVEYSSKVATATGTIGFIRLLFRWKGSIYKVVWMSLLLYMMLFFFLSYLYHRVLDRSQQQIFEKMCIFCRMYVSTVPLSFILGFYVDIVMERWWGQFTKIPWPDAIGFAVITSVKGTSDKSRLIRRTLMRYVNLSFVMTMQLVSPPCKERFPTWDHMVDAGFLLEPEKDIIEHLSVHTDEPKYWLPLAWAANVAAKARKQDKIYDDISFCYLVKEINDFRTKCQTILCYDWICIPIVYTQVVTIACYLYFMCSVLARQFLESSEFVLGQEGEDFNMVVPIFLFVEFFFYFGWLNVAETMVNPFGSDDDDFEVNYFIDRHLAVSYAMVDDITSLMPEMAQDVYWNEKGGVELPYARDKQKLKNRAETFQGSAAGEVVSDKDASFLVDVTPELSAKNLPGLGTSGGSIVSRHFKQDHTSQPPKNAASYEHTKHKGASLINQPEYYTVAVVNPEDSKNPIHYHENITFGSQDEYLASSSNLNNFSDQREPLNPPDHHLASSSNLNNISDRRELLDPPDQHLASSSTLNNIGDRSEPLNPQDQHLPSSSNLNNISDRREPLRRHASLLVRSASIPANVSAAKSDGDMYKPSTTLFLTRMSTSTPSKPPQPSPNDPDADMYKPSEALFFKRFSKPSTSTRTSVPPHLPQDPSIPTTSHDLADEDINTHSEFPDNEGVQTGAILFLKRLSSALTNPFKND